MIIYFLIENFDVDHSPQCLRTHFNIILYRCLGLGPRLIDDVIKSKKKYKNIFPKGIIHVRMQYFSFHVFQSNGKLQVNHKRQVDQKKS